MRKYTWKKRDGWSSPRSLTTLMAVAVLRVVAGKGPFDLTQDGDPIAKDFTRRAVLKRFRVAISNREIGEVFRIRKGNGKVVFTARAVRVLTPGVPCPDPAATDGVKKLWDAIQVATIAAEKHFGRKLDVVFMGIYNCRRISGSYSWSQHAFRNGLDIRIRRTGALASSIDTEATTFVVNKVRSLAAETLWQVPGHTYHAHFTGAPKRYGTPPCA